ncbi:MAG: hypothetical protein K6E14_07440 [Paludibacteraceae bacterium]|nr:hypothetical protein [Paludibacteraceae bacterium]
MSILKEISSNAANSYPQKWEISTFTCDYYGKVERRYFVPVPISFDEDSHIKIVSENNYCTPHWTIRINGSSYYASFNDDDELKAGDNGRLKYDGSTMYFEKY